MAIGQRDRHHREADSIWSGLSSSSSAHRLFLAPYQLSLSSCATPASAYVRVRDDDDDDGTHWLCLHVARVEHDTAYLPTLNPCQPTITGYPFFRRRIESLALEGLCQIHPRRTSLIRIYICIREGSCEMCLCEKTISWIYLPFHLLYLYKISALEISLSQQANPRKNRHDPLTLRERERVE